MKIAFVIVLISLLFFLFYFLGEVNAADWTELCQKSGTATCGSGGSSCYENSDCLASGTGCSVSCPSRANATLVNTCSVSYSNCQIGNPPCGIPAGTCVSTASCSSTGDCQYTCNAGWFNDDGNNANGCENQKPYWYTQSQNTSTPTAGQGIQLNMNWTDKTGATAQGLGVNYTWAEWNITATCTAVWTNQTPVARNNVNSTWSNISLTVPSQCAGGTVVGWRQYANDSADKVNVSSIMTFTVQAGDTTPPTFSNNNANTTNAGAKVNFSVVITDNTALSGYIFSTNNTGTWVNYTWTSMSSGGTAYNITTLNSTVGAKVNYSFYANDSSNNWNYSSWIITTTITDDMPPTYSTNSTNSTLTGTPVEHRLNWTDNIGLSGYIFSFWNGTDLINRTPANVANVSSQAATWPANNTIDDNTATNWEASAGSSHWITYDLGVEVLVTAVRVYSERWSLGLTPCNITVFVSRDKINWGSSLGECEFSNTTGWHWCDHTDKAGRYINLTVKTTDYDGLNCGTNNALTDFYEFDFNSTGFYNDTWVSFSGLTNWSNVTRTVNPTVGVTIGWCVYANDTSNNWNGTSCINPFSYITTSDIIITLESNKMTSNGQMISRPNSDILLYGRAFYASGGAAYANQQLNFTYDTRNWGSNTTNASGYYWFTSSIPYEGSYNLTVKATDSYNNTGQNVSILRIATHPTYVRFRMTYRIGSSKSNDVYRIGTSGLTSETIDDLNLMNIQYANNLTYGYVCTYDQTEYANGLSISFIHSGKKADLSFVNFSTNSTLTNYILELKQKIENDNLLLTYTKGNCQGINDKMYLVESYEIPSRPFSSFSYSISEGIPVLIQFKDDRIQINGSDRFSSGDYKLCVEKSGISSGNKPIIDVRIC